MTSPETHDPLAHPEVRLFSAARSVAGYVISMVSVSLCYLMIHYHRHWSVPVLYGLLSAGAGIGVVAQLVLWLRLDGSPTQRWFTVSWLLFLPFFVLTVGLTAWMFATLYTRTMMPQLMP